MANTDFDAFWQQYSDKVEKETVTILGEQVNLPFDLSLDLTERMNSANVNDKESLGKLLEEVYGEDVLTRWMAKRIGVRQMAILISWTVMKVQGGGLSLMEVAEIMEQGVKSGKLQVTLGNIGAQSNGTSGSSTRSKARNSRK